MEDKPLEEVDFKKVPRLMSRTQILAELHRLEQQRIDLKKETDSLIAEFDRRYDYPGKMK